MPYDVVCEEDDFHKVEHRRDDAEDLKEKHEEESGHTVEIAEYRMNSGSVSKTKAGQSKSSEESASSSGEGL